MEKRERSLKDEKRQNALETDGRGEDDFVAV